jgi:hypothetical protein
MDESFAQLALVVFSPDHQGNSSLPIVEEFFEMGLRQLRTNAGRISSSLHKLGVLPRVSPAFQPSFLRRKVASGLGTSDTEVRATAFP